MQPESQPGEKKTGRPSDYSDGLADTICARLTEGRSMAAICTDEDMPAEGTVYRWLGGQAYFRERYALAREVQADRLVDEILTIADDTANDTAYSASGSPGPNTEWIGRSRLRVESRLKLMALLAPKRYGSKLDLTSGGDKLPVADYSKLSPAALAEILNATAPAAE